MIVAPLPANERARLEAVLKLNLLDSPIEERFERITRLACRTLNVPIASFTLIDESRQWFKSMQGSDYVETPRELAFCTHTILQDDVMLVPDTRQDERFEDNPLVTGDTNISFYAGCPIRGPQGQKVGTICALDTRPRELDEEHVQLLRDLAALVETELRVATLSKSQSDLLAELNTSLRLAMVDRVTRLWNRRGITNLLNREWSQSIRNDTPLALIRIGIDDYARLADRHDETIVNAIVKKIGNRLVNVLRAEDIVGRLDDGEFLAILQDCDADALQAAVRRINAVAETSFTSELGEVLPLTITLGTMTAQPDAGLSPEALIDKAEEALAEAKRLKATEPLPGYL